MNTMHNGIDSSKLYTKVLTEFYNLESLEDFEKLIKGTFFLPIFGRRITMKGFYDLAIPYNFEVENGELTHKEYCGAGILNSHEHKTNSMLDLRHMLFERTCITELTDDLINQRVARLKPNTSIEREMAYEIIKISNPFILKKSLFYNPHNYFGDYPELHAFEESVVPILGPRRIVS